MSIAGHVSRYGNSTADQVAARTTMPIFQLQIAGFSAGGQYPLYVRAKAISGTRKVSLIGSGADYFAGNNCFMNSWSSRTARRRCPRPGCGDADASNWRRTLGSISRAFRKSASAAGLSPSS